MGVRFLESYLEKESRQACFSVDIAKISKEYRRKTGLTPVVVIDGMSCLRPLYNKLSWLNGGQYKEFYDIVKTFLNNFSALGCELVVFFDGPVQSIKLPVWKKRRIDGGTEISNMLESLDQRADILEATCRSSCLPNGLGFIFLYLLSQHKNCKVFKSLQECDLEIASYAKKNNCFAILGQDTDYVIYRAAHYYLSIKNLNLNNMTTLCYCGHMLSVELNIPVNHLTLLASLVGNDIVSYELVKDFHYSLYRYTGIRNSIISVAQYIKNLKHNDLSKISWEVMGSYDKADLLRESIASYDLNNLKPLCLKDLLAGTIADRNWSKIVEYITQSYIKSFTTGPLYDIIVNCQFYSAVCLENYKPEKIIVPVGDILKELRRSTYGILLHEKPLEPGKKEHFVSELVMTGFQSMDGPVLVKPKYLTRVEHPGLVNLMSSKDKKIEEIRWKILADVFSCEVESILCLPLWLVVPALSTRYFKIQFPSLNDWELNAILASNVIVRNYQSKDLAKLPSGPLTYRPVWLYTAISRTYTTVNNLLYYIGNPVPFEHTLPYLFTDGKLFHEKYRQSREKIPVNSLCNLQVESLELFNLLKTFVLSPLKT